MAVNMKQFVAELRAFDGRRDVVKAMRRRIRRPAPKVRQAIKRNALATLPGRGGLGVWAAASKTTVTIRYASARSAGVRMKGSRKSNRDKSDLAGLDAGVVRAPSWGRRGAGQWHSQKVAPGWFTDPVVESDEWRAEIERAVDEAFDTIRRG